MISLFHMLDINYFIGTVRCRTKHLTQITLQKFGGTKLESYHTNEGYYIYVPKVSTKGMHFLNRAGLLVLSTPQRKKAEKPKQEEDAASIAFLLMIHRDNCADKDDIFSVKFKHFMAIVELCDTSTEAVQLKPR